MARILAALLGGVVIGVVAMLAVGRVGPPDEPKREIVRDLVAVPRMTESDAEVQRGEHYAGLASVQQILALPTEFVRAEAMHALAGRSDSADVQRLIFEASRIADAIEREKLLTVLFFRLAELDPRSALALARTDDFRGTRALERAVWSAWARGDLDDALFGAKTQTSTADRNAAAQSLYAAFGYMGNETTERIEEELGIGPDRSTRARYLYRLADESPADAIAFINTLEPSLERTEYVSWLAYYLSLHDPTAALAHAGLFGLAAEGERYRSIIAGQAAREDPKATIDRLLAGGQRASRNGEFHSAVRALASTDLNAVRQYFEQARSADERGVFGSAIAAELAHSDPMAAIEWARAHDEEPFGSLQMTVFLRIAQSDPQLALTEASKIANAQRRSNIIANVVQNLARSDPQQAVGLLEQIENPQDRLQASQRFAHAWMRSDPDAAVDWILSRDPQEAEALIRIAGSRLVASDIDAAIRLLPRMGELDQQMLRQQIAKKLAMSSTPGEAQAFIRQFEGQPGYEHLQESLIAGVAQKDALMARQLADQLADGVTRDRAYAQVITLRAQTDPGEAIRWLNNIGDDAMRGMVAGQVAGEWYRNDPPATLRWVTGLPAGPAKDDAIVAVSSRWQGAEPELESLIDDILDDAKRSQAKIRRIYGLMRTNPARARELLQDADIPSHERHRVETMIRKYSMSF